MKKNTIIYLLLIISVNLFAANAFAIQEKEWPAAINGAIDYLLKFADPKSGQEFNSAAASPLMKFITDEPDPKNILYHSGDSGNPSAFYRFEIKRSLTEIIQYGFNPDISTVLLRPSSVRLSHWTEVEGEKKELPKLWHYFSDLSSPVVLRGVEQIEITPDTNSGTYFSYDMNRTFIFFLHNGRKAMISLSQQKDKSTTGKKGLIVGPDNDWNYLYTGETGVNKMGLGWVRSHIYHSHNITVFYENDTDGSSVRCAIFNWIKAGWAGINMVNNQHIYNGIDRFAVDFKAIIENSNLPDPAELARRLDRFKEMSTPELKERARLYLERLERDYADKEKQLAKLLEKQEYLDKLSREEMINMLIKEYTKVLIGKQQADYLLGRLDDKDPKK